VKLAPARLLGTRTALCTEDGFGLGGARNVTFEVPYPFLVAIMWVAQQRLPMVLLSASQQHLEQNLRVNNATAWRLTADAIERLSALEAPPGRPSHWGNCVDVPAPGRSHHATANLIRVVGEQVPARCWTRSALGRLNAAARRRRLEAVQSLASLSKADSCDALRRAQRALLDHVSASANRTGTAPGRTAGGTWAPLEGAALSVHPDPLGALLRAEVPAVVLRGLVRPQTIASIRRRIWLASAEHPPNSSGSCFCSHLDPGDRSGDGCHPQRDRRTCTWGPKLAAGLMDSRVASFWADCEASSKERRNLSTQCEREGVVPRDCSAFGAMLNGIRERATTSGVGRVKVASETAAREYSAGVLLGLPTGFRYPLHFDSLHANAWNAIRSSHCDEQNVRVLDGAASNVKRVALLHRHTFAASAILTLRAPERGLNPYDLRIYRVRWTDIVLNCSLVSQAAGGIFQRLGSATAPLYSWPHVDIQLYAVMQATFTSSIRSLCTRPRPFVGRIHAVCSRRSQHTRRMATR
jgi:hypothetical protein